LADFLDFAREEEGATANLEGATANLMDAVFAKLKAEDLNEE
jgi:hypothetical protein